MIETRALATALALAAAASLPPAAADDSEFWRER